MLAFVTISEVVPMLFVHLFAGQRGDGLLDALLADVVRLLGDERLHLAGLSCLIWSGPASKPTTLTVPDLPACRTPVAMPCAVNRLVAKTPARSGSLAAPPK